MGNDIVKIKMVNYPSCPGNLYSGFVLNEIYEAIPVKIGHYYNHRAIDSKGENILISNTGLRKYFKIIKTSSNEKANNTANRKA